MNLQNKGKGEGKRGDQRLENLHYPKGKGIVKMGKGVGPKTLKMFPRNNRRIVKEIPNQRSDDRSQALQKARSEKANIKFRGMQS